MAMARAVDQLWKRQNTNSDAGDDNDDDNLLWPDCGDHESWWWSDVSDSTSGETDDYTADSTPM